MFSDVPDEICGLLDDLNSSLPTFEQHMALFPVEPSLQWPLQDIYEEYMDFCVNVIRYLQRPANEHTLIQITH